MHYFYKTDSESYAYNVGAKFDDGKLLISDWAMGENVEDAFGDSDIEHYVIIDSKDCLSFIKACADHGAYTLPKGRLSEEQMIDALMAVFKDDEETIFKVKDIVKKNNITHQFQRW